MSPVEDAVALLTDAGYTVFLPPACKRPGGHGRHSLMTRSAMCPGVEPIPHGLHSVRTGSFGPIVDCRCGSSFRHDDWAGTGRPSQWEKHKAEHDIADVVTPSRTDRQPHPDVLSPSAPYQPDER